MASVVGKTIFSDGKGKLFFGYYKDNDAVEFVDYKTWKKLPFKDVSKGDTNKQRVIKAIVKNQKQFNKKVDFNMWAKQKKRTFEETMDWFIKNGWISNVTKRGVKESVDVLSVNESASRTAMEIGGLTGMNKDAIQKFVDDNNLDIEKVFQFVKKGKLKDRMDFVAAIAGKPNNPIQKKMVKMFGESVTEGKKRFKVNPAIGKVKYSISSHDGVKKHKDGSDFFDIETFKNKVDLEKAIKKYTSKGFKMESVNEGKDDFVARHGKANIILKKGYKHHKDTDLEKLYYKLGSLVKGLKVKDVTLVFESVNEDTKKRFDVDFYKGNGDRQTSHEEIIRGDKFSDVVSQATKVAKSKGMNYVEFYHRDFFIGSIDKRNGYQFKKGRDSQKSPLSVNEAKFGYKTSTASYINKHKDEYKVAEKMNKGNEMRFYDDLQKMEDKIGHPKTMLFISNALRGYGVDMYKDPKIKNPADAQEALFLLSK